MARWTFLVADLRTNIVIGELPLLKPRMIKLLNGSGQMQATLKLGDERIALPNPRDLTMPARRALYALRDGTPWWGGIIWGSDYDSAEQSVNIVCADWWSYFDHRKVLEVLTLPAAPFYIAGLSTLYTQIDQNQIARDLVTLAQSHTGGDIGIEVDGAFSGILRDRIYDGFNLTYVGQALRDIAGLADGCDIVFDVAGLDAQGRPRRIMRTGIPALTQAGAPWRWDLGGNMGSFVWARGGGVMTTRAFAQGVGTERGTQIAVAENTTRYDDGWPLLETDDTFADTETIALQEDADGLLAGLTLPLLTFRMTVTPDISPTLGEYNVGDAGFAVIPPARDPWVPEGMNMAIRILSIEVSLDENEQESTVVTAMTQQEVV